MFTKSKNLFLALFTLLVIGGVFFATNQNKVEASGPWGCGDGSAGFMNSGVIKWCDDYFIFNPQRTQEAGGNPVFESGKDAGSDGDHHPIFFLEMVPGTNNTYGVRLKDGAGNIRSQAVFLHEYERAEQAFKAKDGTEYCSLVKYENCVTYNGKEVETPSGNFSSGTAGGWAFDGSTYVGPAFTQEQIDKIKNILTGQAATETANESCQNAAGTLGFLLCPLFESISQSITNIVGVNPNAANATVNPDAPLMSLLIVRPLQFSSSSTLQTANNNVRDVANAAYVVIFIVIIFASFIDFGQDWIDNYTVKRVLPRLVAAIIFTQFSYLICAFVIDAGNAIGFAIPQIMGSTGLVANGQNSIQNALVAISGVAGGGALGIFAGFGGFLLALIFCIAVLVVLLIALVYMIFRLFALYLLVIVAPLAIAASVLPSTGKYFKMWGTNLIKLNIMFPLVVAVITVSGIISGILITEGCSAGGANTQLCTDYFNAVPGSTTAASQVQGSGSMLIIAGALIPLFALMLIPKCLKLSGEIMAFTAGAVAGRVTGKLGDAKSGVANKGKESVQKQLSEGKAAELRGKFQRGKGSAYARVPGLKRRGARNIAAGGARIGAYKKSLSGPIESMDGESLAKLVQATGGRGKVGEVARGELAKKYNEASERQANRRRNGQPEDPGLNAQMAKMDSALLTAMSKDEKFDVAVHVPETPAARNGTVERIREAAPTAQAKVLGSTRKVESMDAGSVAAILAGRSAAGDRAAGGGSAEIVTALEGIRAELRGAHRTAVEDYLSR